MKLSESVTSAGEDLVTNRKTFFDMRSRTYGMGQSVHPDGYTAKNVTEKINRITTNRNGKPDLEVGTTDTYAFDVSMAYRNGQLWRRAGTSKSKGVTFELVPPTNDALREVVRYESTTNMEYDGRTPFQQIGDALRWVASIKDATMADWSNFFAGWADALTFGATQKFREAAGYDDVVDKTSSQYSAGSAVGTVHSMAIGFGGAAKGALGLVAKGLQATTRGMGVANGLQEAGQAAANGDALGFFRGLGNAVAMGTAGRNLCGLGSVARGAVNGAIGAGAAAHGIDAINKFASGDFWGGMGSLGQGLLIASQFKACYTGETPLRMADGTSKRIDEIVVGDVVLSRSEFDPQGGVQTRVVLQTFVRVSPILNLHVAGRIIGTTAEHPFYVIGSGWRPASALRTGDHLRGLGDDILVVEGVADSGRIETAYNLEVAEDHTYFVGSIDDPAVWAHNATYPVTSVGRKGVLRHIGMFDDFARYNWQAPTGVAYELLLKTEQVGHRLLVSAGHIQPVVMKVGARYANAAGGFSGLSQLAADLGTHFGVRTIEVLTRFRRTNGRGFGPATFILSG